MQLFHQNMRNFGGADALRNAEYDAQFTAIAAAGAAAAPPQQIVVAGFTEITNNGASAAALAGLCNALGVNFVHNIACGRTALAQGGPEYVCIGVSNVANVVGVGRVVLHSDGGHIGLVDDYSAIGAVPANWCDTLPDNATYDYRGLVYVVMNVPGLAAVGGVAQSAAFGFIHNMYSFEAQRVLVVAQLPNMLRMIGARSTLNVAYIGGDLNVDPLPRGGGRIGRAYLSSSALGAAPAGHPYMPPPPPPAFVVGGTTWRGSFYDYWYSSIDPGVAPPVGINQPVAAVDGRTLDSAPGVGNWMSDHCATLLTI